MTSPYHPSSNGLAECAVQTFKNLIRKLEGDVQKRISKIFIWISSYSSKYHCLSFAELLMGQRLRTHLDLLHPDTSCNVIKKQDKLTAVIKRCRKFSLVDCLYAKNFKGPDKWSSVTVTHITGPVSYQVQNSSGTIQHHHVDHLHYHYPLNSDDQESNNFDDWPFSSTTSSTDASSNLEQCHGQSNIASSTTSSLQRSNRTHKAVDRYGPYLSN